MYTDKILICKDCGERFTFTAGEQEFFEEHGFDKEPLRCARCRRQRKNSVQRRNARALYEIVCSECGAVEAIPFEPKHDRPVFCSACYRKHSGI